MPRIAPSAAQQRSFWNSIFNQPNERRRKTKKLLPGLDVMQDLSKAEMLDSRRPKEEDLRAAIRAFFQSKEEKNEGIDEVAAGHALRTLARLQLLSKASKDTEEKEEVSRNSDKPVPWIHINEIRRAMRTIARIDAREAARVHRELALSLRDAFIVASPTGYGTVGAASFQQDILDMVKMLSHLGMLLEARDVLSSVLMPDRSISEPTAQTGYSIILSGLDYSGGTEDQLNATLENMASHQIPLNTPIQRSFVKFYAHRDNLKKAIENLELLMTSTESPDGADEVTAIIEACIRARDEKVGRAVLANYLEQHADSRILWTSVFKFAAAVGRGADEVERMMSVMEERKAESVRWSVDIEMINSLVEFAMEREDPYLAERFIALGQKRGIQPDGLTHIYQVNYRLSIDDVDGALAAYQEARSLPGHVETDSTRLAQEIDAINNLVQAMCKIERRYSFETIMKIVDNLNEKPNTRFHAATVANLTILHLRREEYHDVVDLLNMHAAKYSVADRHLVRDTMVSYCFDLRNSIAKVWDCYQIFRQVFDGETPREVRTAIMNEFYRRRRADMAYHVFSHMRDSHNEDVRAQSATYVDALVGIGQCKDEETLEFVHNKLKLDPNVEPDTKLNNALMLAYIGIGDARRAIEFWEDIVVSSEGPSYNSIPIVLRACEVKPYGVDQGKIIWDRLMQLDIDVTKEVFTAWCACLVGNGYTKQVREMLRRAGEFGIELDDWV